MKRKVDQFNTVKESLARIDELKKKYKCEGLLNNTPQKDGTYVWTVTYDPYKLVEPKKTPVIDAKPMRYAGKKAVAKKAVVVKKPKKK